MPHTLKWAISAALVLVLASCIDVQSEVDRRKDVTTGAVSNRLPKDVRSGDSTLPDLPDTVQSDVSSVDLLDAEGDEFAPDVELFDGAETFDGDGLDGGEVDICVPQCDGLECGPDMCGGLCGFCPGDEVCSLGQCKNCSPDCDFKECGLDGCGGVCGTCPSKFSCISNLCKAPACTEEVQVFLENFDSCSQGAFGIFDTQPDDNITWWGVELKSASPPCSLYLGNPLTLNYDTGATIKLELLSAPIELPAGVALQLTFQLYMLTEVLPSPLYPYDHDVLFLYFDVPDMPSAEVWSSKSILNNTGNEMVPIAIDISEFAGQNGRFRFLFDTLNSVDNDNPGIYLDDFSVATICPYCEADEDCADDDPCTDNVCVFFSNFEEIGTCFMTPIEDCVPPEEEPEEE